MFSYKLWRPHCQLFIPQYQTISIWHSNRNLFTQKGNVMFYLSWQPSSNYNPSLLFHWSDKRFLSRFGCESLLCDADLSSPYPCILSWQYVMAFTVLWNLTGSSVLLKSTSISLSFLKTISPGRVSDSRNLISKLKSKGYFLDLVSAVRTYGVIKSVPELTCLLLIH